MQTLMSTLKDIKDIFSVNYSSARFFVAPF